MSFIVSDKIDTVAKVDAHTGTCGDLASVLGVLVSTLSTIVKNHETTERSYIQ